MVAVPWLQHSQRFGHCALSHTVCSRRSEMSALVEKKTGFEGKRTLIHGGLLGWWSEGSILAQDIGIEITGRGIEKQPVVAAAVLSGRIAWPKIISAARDGGSYNFVRPDNAW
jgi:hypothetical protein